MNDKQIRTIYAGLLGLVVVTIIAGAGSAYFVAPSASGGTDSGQIQMNTITVSGTGTITMPPDEVTVYLGVETTSEDAATAQQINAGVPSKAHIRQLVKIQPEERLATTSELNPTPSLVTD